ncbi:MAG: sulfurtransferase [Betaproteobacteria bacterium]|nr:sulfurtransferase [Betaproteobacteria bacterium]
MRAAIVWLAMAACVLAVAAGAAGAAETYADEDRSWGIEPPPGYRAKDYHGPTPDTLPGARVVGTAELKEMLARDPRPFLIDVLSGPAHRSLPGALWLHNGGLGDFDATEEQRFLDVLARLSGHDKAREIVFFCSGSRCWLSYNAALRATRAGYSNVYWYRGGIEAWREAGFPTRTTDNFQW